MSTFEQAIPTILAHEGATLVDNSEETSKYGIGLNTLKLLGLAQDRAFVLALTAESAAAFYHDHYWAPYPFESITSQLIATKVFDLSVVMGAKSAFQIVQAALNHGGANLALDGLLGPKTLAAINGSEEDRLLSNLCSTAASHFIAISRLKPEKKKYLRGWLTRAEWPLREA